MKKNYIAPEAGFIVLSSKDVIQASGNSLPELSFSSGKDLVFGLPTLDWDMGTPQ